MGIISFQHRSYISSQTKFDTVQTGKTGGWYASQGSYKANMFLYGKQWTEVRRYFREAFMTAQRRDPQIKKEIRKNIQPYTPVRSGHLYDFICRTLNLIRRQWYSSHYYIDTEFQYPMDRPLPIPGRVKHSPPDKGYSKLPKPSLRFTHPSVHMLRPPTTRGGQALYLLNDPTAENNISSIMKVANERTAEDIKEQFNDVLLTFIVKHAKSVGAIP